METQYNMGNAIWLLQSYNTGMERPSLLYIFLKVWKGISLVTIISGLFLRS